MSKSAYILADGLSINHAKSIISFTKGKCSLIYFDGYSWKLPLDFNPGLLINWGTAKFKYSNIPVLNKRHFILLSYNKPFMRLLLKNNNIPVPDTFINIPDAPFPYILRSNTHYSGKNFFVVNNKSELDKIKYNYGWYASEIYPKNAEYRVHVGSGNIIAISKKKF